MVRATSYLSEADKILMLVWKDFGTDDNIRSFIKTDWDQQYISTVLMKQ